MVTPVCEEVLNFHQRKESGLFSGQSLQNTTVQFFFKDALSRQCEYRRLTEPVKIGCQQVTQESWISEL